jgi:hypothetical protein
MGRSQAAPLRLAWRSRPRSSEVKNSTGRTKKKFVIENFENLARFEHVR